LKTFKDIQAAVIAEMEKNPRNGDEPLSSALSANGWLPDTPLKRTVDWLLDFEYAVKPALMSTRHYEGLPEENSFVTDSRGFRGIIDYLDRNFTSKIKTEKAVTEIKYSSNGVEVRTKDNEIYKAKYGLCTFSTGVLASELVEFIPELPKWKKDAISRIPLAYHTNIFVRFSNAFWEDTEFIANAGSTTETFPYLYNLNKNGIQKGSNVLLFTAVEDNSLRIEAQSENETLAEVMKTLKEMYPNTSIPHPVGKLKRELFSYGVQRNKNLKRNHDFARTHLRQICRTFKL
jgi:polyamine oxidase